MEIKLSELIAPQFYDIHWDILKGKHTHYKLYGGRGSTKSSFVSIEIILGMMQDPNANAACFRRVGNTLAESVFEQLLWAIDALKVNHLWKVTLSPLRLTYKPTGQRIVFRGCDDPNKSKSIKLRHGYFKYIWYEERAEFEGDEDERKINQSLMRGGDKYVVFYTWNPPKSLNSWVNQDVLQVRDDTLCSHSTYLTVAMEYKLLGLEMITKVKERRYKIGLRKRIRLYCNFLGMQAIVVEDGSIVATFSRALPKNLQELAQIVANLSNMVSAKTLLKQIPFVEDPDYEIEAVNEQKAEDVKRQQELFAQGANTPPDFGDEGSSDDEEEEESEEGENSVNTQAEGNSDESKEEEPKDEKKPEEKAGKKPEKDKKEPKE